jgi:S-adenosyl methyltransferase
VAFTEAKEPAMARGPVPFFLDVTVPSVARVYDVFLDGKDNFAADRAVARSALKIAPDSAGGAKSNRAFLRRAVRYLAAEAGITQFLDIGSGLPSAGNVHEVAREACPAARVVYTDNDPAVAVHGRALLADTDTARFVTADARRPAEVLDDPGVRAFLDLSRPVGLLMLAVLHHISDADDPAAITSGFRDALAPGSYLAISSLRMPGPDHPQDAEKAREVQTLFNETLGTCLWRDDSEILAWFGDWELLEPGLVPLPDWRPDTPGPPVRDSTYHGFVAGVARKG